MPYTRSFEGFKPPRRFDSVPFETVEVRESATEDGTYATIETIALSPVDTDPANPASRNFTTDEAVEAIGWYVIRWVDGGGAFSDSVPVRFGATGANAILTLSEYKTAESITSTQYDEQIEQIITQVSAAIRRLTGRDFGAVAQIEERVFEYPGGGVLNIDDATAIVSVSMDGASLAQDRDYRPKKDSETPYFYLDMYVEPGRSGSPEMGFTRNEDTYRERRPSARPALVTVEAEYGWNPVPEDVKLAALEMARVVADLPKDDIQNETIAEYSYSNVPDTFNSGRWPTRAVDLLRPYKRINL